MISVTIEDFENNYAVGLGERIDRLILRGEAFVITRNDVPEVVMTPVDQHRDTDKRKPLPLDVPHLTVGAPPEVIRLHLLDEDRPTFDAQHEQMSDAQKEREGWYERWFAHAVIQSDRQKFWELAGRMARRNWPDMPEGVPDHVVRLIAGL